MDFIIFLGLWVPEEHEEHVTLFFQKQWKEKKEKILITLFNWFMFVIVFFVFVILC